MFKGLKTCLYCVYNFYLNTIFKSKILSFELYNLFYGFPLTTINPGPLKGSNFQVDT
jgi:hypothetical protein